MNMRLRLVEYALFSILGLISEHEKPLLEGPEKFGFPVRKEVNLSELRPKFAE